MWTFILWLSMGPVQLFFPSEELCDKAVQHAQERYVSATFQYGVEIEECMPLKPLFHSYAEPANPYSEGPERLIVPYDNHEEGHP